jgi:hypothetical protein
MMLLLRDDGVIETFASPDSPPDWIEPIDVQNQEYSFCDLRGQKYKGEMTKRVGVFGSGAYRLVPYGPADPRHTSALLDRATGVEGDERFPDLDSLRRHIEDL